jgi:ribose 5-phosphate isomerase B
MKVHIATDHAGFELKEFLRNKLEKSGYKVIDHGAYEYDKNDDYTDFCIKCSKAVLDDNQNNDGTNDYESLGIVIGGSGNGEQIISNKVTGIRAALGWSIETAELSRQHNNANVIGIGARMHNNEQALKIVKAFIDTKFSHDERHKRRIKKISEY